MNGIIFTPDRNHRRADYVGAFKPEAETFASINGIPNERIHAIDISGSDADMRAQVLSALESDGDPSSRFDVVAFFCHGWKTGMQLGFSVSTLGELTTKLNPYVKDDVIVPLYACSAASDADLDSEDDLDPNAIGGDGGFADELRDGLCADGHAVNCRVIAHVTAGHTTKNPFVRYFDGAGMPYGGTGGYWLFRPHGPLWSKWRGYLRTGNNRLTFPFEDVATLRATVSTR